MTVYKHCSNRFAPLNKMAARAKIRKTFKLLLLLNHCVDFEIILQEGSLDDLLPNRVGQGPTALAVGAGGGCFDIFTLIYPFSFLSPSLWETTRYRLKYCLKGSLSPETTYQQQLYQICLLKPFRSIEQDGRES